MEGFEAMENPRIARVMLRTFTSLGLFLFALAAHTSAMEPEFPTPTDQPQRLTAPTVENFKQAADYSAKHRGRAVLVMRAGKNIFERYDNGFGPDTATHLHSATKGFWGAVIAAMIEDGLIESYDELASKTLPEWKEHPRKRRITLRHLLTLSAGLVQDIVNLQGHDRPTLAPDLYKHAIGVQAGEVKTGVVVFADFCSIVDLLVVARLPHGFVDLICMEVGYASGSFFAVSQSASEVGGVLPTKSG